MSATGETSCTLLFLFYLVLPECACVLSFLQGAACSAYRVNRKDASPASPPTPGATTSSHSGSCKWLWINSLHYYALLPSFIFTSRVRVNPAWWLGILTCVCISGQHRKAKFKSFGAAGEECTAGGYLQRSQVKENCHE